MLQIGIIGLPNVGKSTLFQALTKKQVDISNYPFTTIEPNVGVVQVPDKRLDQLHNLLPLSEKIPATITFVDIAGLVKNANTGEGLGNQFLAYIREVDAIAHAVRIFENSMVSHIHGAIDPAYDIEIVRNELQAADEQTKIKRSEHKKTVTEPLRLLTDKPALYVFNVSVEQLAANWQPDTALRLALKEAPFGVVSADLELLLADQATNERNEYLNAFGIKQYQGINKLIDISYKLLNLITFYTIAGNRQTRAWPLKYGVNILEAAGKIHTDFEKKFIRAEVINWQELTQTGSWQKAKELGELQFAGKEYIIQDGDVVEFKQ